MVVCDIQATIAARDEYMAAQEDAERKLRTRKESLTQFHHIYLGSPCKPVKISSLLEAHNMDEAYIDFSKKLKKCIQDLVNRPNDTDRLEIPGPITSRDVEVSASDDVSQFNFIYPISTLNMHV